MVKQKTVSVAPSVWEDKGHYIRYKNTRIYNNRVTVGIDDTVDVKKYPPIGLPGITGSETSGVVKTISGHTYGNGSYIVEWSSDTGGYNPSLLFNGNQNEGAGAHTGAFYNSNGEIIPYSGSSYHYLVSDYYGEWISLEFPERIYFTFIKLHPRRAYPYESPKDYKVYGQNNDLTWDEILHVSDAIYSNNVHVSGHYSPKKSYKKYGLVVNKVFSPGTILNFSEIEFFGIPDETLNVTTDEFAEDTTDMLAWYKFDGDLTDSSGKGNDLTNTACVFDSSSVISNSQCVAFTGSSYLRQSNTIYCPSQTSICFWGYFTGNGWSQIISTQSGATGWLIQISDANTIRILISNNQPDVFTFGASGLPSYNQWFHFALVLNSVTNIHHAYVNGALIQTYTHTYTPVTQSLSIGTQLGTPEYYLKDGEKLDDVRIYNRALTSEEIKAIYRVGKPVLYDFFADTSDMLAWYKFDGDFTDSSGNGKQLTTTEDTTIVSLSSDSVTGTGSVYFSGQQTLQSTLRNGNINLTGINKAFSICYWFKRAENNRWDMVSFGSGRNIDGSLYIGYRGDRDNNKLQFGTLGSSGAITSTAFTDDVGKWIHLSFVSDPNHNKRYIYRNGKLELSLNMSTNLNIIGTDFILGANTVDSAEQKTKGNYDDLRIYNRALTPDEVHTLYAKSGMISDGHVELHNIKADQLMPYNDSSINIGKHVKIRASVGVAENLSSRIVNSEVDVTNTRTNPYAMKLEKDLWMDGAGIIWTSDQRIKKEITDIDDDVALQQILTIEPKTYKYIDNVNKGDNTVYGFISQQIEEVIPEATKKTPRYIPNVYQYCEYNSSNNTIRLPGDFDISRLNTLIADKYSSNYDDMSSNIVVSNDNHLSTRLKVIDENNQETFLQYSMTSNEDGYELQIHNRDFRAGYESYPDSIYSNNSSNIFVYGTEINDLTTLDKSYIYTLNTCATQVLSRKVDSLRLTNETLSQYVETLERRISIIRDYVNANSNVV